MISFSYVARAALLLLSSKMVVQPFVPPRHNHVARTTTTTTTTTTTLGMFDFLKEGKKALVKKLAGDYDEVAIQNRLDGLVKKNKVLMLSFTTCPFCIKAKGILDSKKSKPYYTVVELDQDVDGKAIRAVMGETLGRTSVPAIWINGQFIGGCNDGPLDGGKGLVQLDESGQLDALLRAARVL